MAPPPVSQRAIAAMRIGHAIGAVLLGVALVANLLGRPALASAAMIPVIFVLLFSMEALRVLVTSPGSDRR